MVQPCSLFDSNSHTRMHALARTHTHTHFVSRVKTVSVLTHLITSYNVVNSCLIPVINIKKEPKLSESACTSVNLTVINFPWSDCLFQCCISAGCSQCCLCYFSFFQAVTAAAGGCYVCQNVPPSSLGFLFVTMMYYIF